MTKKNNDSKRSFVYPLDYVEMNCPERKINLVRKYDEDTVWSIWYAMAKMLQKNFRINDQSFIIAMYAEAFIDKNEYVGSSAAKGIGFKRIRKNPIVFDPLISGYDENKKAKARRLLKDGKVVVFNKNYSSDDDLWKEFRENQFTNPPVFLDGMQTVFKIANDPSTMACYRGYHVIGHSFACVVGKDPIGPANRLTEEEYQKKVEECFNSLSGDEQALLVIDYCWSVFKNTGEANRKKYEQANTDLFVSYIDGVEETPLDVVADKRHKCVLSMCEKNIKTSPFSKDVIVKIDDYKPKRNDKYPAWVVATKDKVYEHYRDPNFICEDNELNAEWTELLVPYSKKNEVLDSFDDAYDRAIKCNKGERFLNLAKEIRQFIVEFDDGKTHLPLYQIYKKFGCGHVFAEEVIDWFRNAMIARYKFDGNDDVRFKVQRYNPLSAEENIDIVISAYKMCKQRCDKKDLPYLDQGVQSLIDYIKGGDKPLDGWRIAHDIYYNQPYYKRDCESEREARSFKVFDVMKEELQYAYEEAYEEKYRRTSPVTFFESIYHGGSIRTASPYKKKIHLLTIDDPNWDNPFGIDG